MPTIACLTKCFNEALAFVLLPGVLKPASPVASATRCIENAEANVRHLSPDRRQIDPEPTLEEKASDVAHVRPEQAIPCSRWSLNPSIYRMTAGSAPQPMALQVGSRLGHYDVTALIDEGGMGQVYWERDTKKTTMTERDVAWI